jgi:hypothetical protein
MTNFKKQKDELTGKIVKLDFEMGFGFIRSDVDGVDYYFKLANSVAGLCKNDSVIFLLEKSVASAVRKIYINSHGVRFYSRINQNHVHLLLEEYLPLIIDNITNYDKEFLELETNLTFYVGKSDCVETDESDSIIYAKRKGRTGYTRFVLNREPIDCNSVFLVLKRTEIGYLIITVFVGKKAGREPWDLFSTNEDVEFWENHALVFNKENIVDDSLTTECPWKVLTKN